MHNGGMTPNENLFVALRDAFPDDRDAVAIETTGDAPLFYRFDDLERATARLANLLDTLGLPAGSRVAAHVDKSVEALLLYLAVLRAGYVYLPLNPAYQQGELTHFLQDAEPAVVVCSGANFGWVSKLAFTSGVTHVFTLNTDRTGTLLDRASFHGDTHEPAARAASDLAVILYTSGTTGRSKGAMLTHGNMLANARTLKKFWQWRAGDVLIHALPIFHIHGLFVACHGALLNGSRILWFDRFEPGRVLARFADATLFMGVPTMYVRLLAEAGLTTDACRSIRLFISGSAPLLPDTFREWQRRTGHVLLERYGMSETVMLTSNPVDGERRPGTVGRPLPGVEVRIASPDADSGNGGIEVRGPNVFAGYWRLPEKTKEEFTADGWFRTGDVGRIDADGYVQIVGRAKDLVISGGFNVYPAEVEAVMDDLPGVAETAVIGVPHPDFGEAVVAVVVPRPGATLDPAALVAAVKARLANFKVPKQVFVVDDLPRNAMGKVQKKALRDRYATLFA